MVEANKTVDAVRKEKLDQFSQAMGIDGMAIRKHFLELAVQSQIEGDPVEIADRFLDYVIGEQLGPRCELLKDEMPPQSVPKTQNTH
jgi:hypothetical protein